MATTCKIVWAGNNKLFLHSSTKVGGRGSRRPLVIGGIETLFKMCLAGEKERRKKMWLTAGRYPYALDGQVNFPLWSMPCTLTSGSGEHLHPQRLSLPPDPRKLMYEVRTKQFQPLRTSVLCVRKGHVDDTGLKKKGTRESRRPGYQNVKPCVLLLCVTRRRRSQAKSSTISTTTCV
jgi:hypothetical protein